MQITYRRRRYLSITEANTTQRRFLFGWIKERVAM